MDGDAMAVAATRDRVYVVGYFDHTVPDPNDPCLDLQELPPGSGHGGVSCPDGSPSRHLAASTPPGRSSTGRTPASRPAQADTSEGPYAVVIGVNQMYVGGNFSKVASTPTAAGGMRVRQPGFAIYPSAA